MLSKTKTYDYETEFHNIVKAYENNELVTAYLKSLSEDDVKAMVISQVILESSFDVERCIGFKEFVRNK